MRHALHLRRNKYAHRECGHNRDVILCATSSSSRCEDRNEAAGVHSGYCGAARFATARAGARAASPDRFLDPLLRTAARDAWRSGLRERGWIEGKNLLVEYRYHVETPDRVPALAAELVALDPDLVIAVGPQAALTLKSATATIPIVFVGVADPVALGLVQSLSHPGGNIAGLTTLVPGGLLAKRIEILRELVPGASKIAILINPNNPLHRLGLGDEIPRGTISQAAGSGPICWIAKPPWSKRRR